MWYLVVLSFSCYIYIADMATFEGSEDEYDNIFITQESKHDNVVSLEDNDGFKSVLDSKYSDISDDEDNAMEKRLR